MRVTRPDHPDEVHADRAADRIAKDPAAETIGGAVDGAGGLSPSARELFEPRLGLPLGGVKLHRDERAAALAGALGARAFTRGDDIFFGEGQYAPGTPAGRRLLAHELAHVAQARRGEADPGVVHREPVHPEKMKVSGDAERTSPKGGVAISGGILEWTLKFVGEAGTVTPAGEITKGRDVAFAVTYTPKKPGCGTIAFIQTVLPTHGGGPELGGHVNLLYTRDKKTGASVDALEQATTPYANAKAAPKGGLEPQFAKELGHRLAGTDKGRSTSAYYTDAPVAGSILPGGSVERRFETAPICVDTGETFGSISWGYTKKADGTITLTGATQKDVQSKTATSALEDIRQAFYAGTFQKTLPSFARGSSALTADHKTTLKAIAAQQPRARKITLVGANDNSGGPEASAALSLERAEAAKQFLTGAGVDAASITTEGIGVAARVQNPAGKEVPANRRVDIRLDYGAERTRRGQPGDPGDIQPLRRLDPRSVIDEIVRSIFDISSTQGEIPRADWQHLQDALDSLDRWRKVDPTIPDVREIFKSALDALGKRPVEPVGKAKAKDKTKIPRVPPDTSELPIPDGTPPGLKADLEKVNEALRAYNDAKKRLAGLEQQKKKALGELEEEKKLVDEELKDQ